MRIIENKIIETTQSPIKGLLNDLHPAIINIAPERAAEFDEKFNSFTIEYLDDDEYIANVQIESKHIKISTGAFELLWVLAYAHFQYYYKVIQKIGCEEEIEIGPDHLSEMLPAIDLLNWAMNRHFNHLEWRRNGGKKPERNPWPTNLPSLLSSSDDLSDEAVASEFTRGAVAALIHHELAHIELGHSGSSEIDPEKDADAHSWDWILGSKDTGGDAAELKRILMLIHAALVGVAVDTRLKRNTLIGHPRNIDRLSNLLGRFELDPNDLAYAFCLTILQFHSGFTDHKFGTPGIEYASFQDAFEAIADYISTFETETI
ncbi:MAG: phage exclusion protein Lit family protein [Verrucomicrobiota bacterium]